MDNSRREEARRQLTAQQVTGTGGSRGASASGGASTPANGWRFNNAYLAPVNDQHYRRKNSATATRTIETLQLY